MADEICTALLARRTRLVPGLPNRVAALAGKAAPVIIETAMQRTLFARLARPTAPTQQLRLG